MKALHFTPAVAAALLAGLISSQAAAADVPNLIMYGAINVKIENGSTVTSVLNMTDFGVVHGTRGLDISASNHEGAAELVFTSPITVSGPNAADFTVVQPTGPVPYGYGAPVHIDFTPQEGLAGLRTAVITVHSNAPGADSNYSFAVSGDAELANAPVSAGMAVTPSRQIRATISKHTGRVVVKWKIRVQNDGPVSSPKQVLRIYRSEDDYLSLDHSELLAEYPVKAIQLPRSGIAKPRMVKVKLDVEQASGYLFAAVATLPGDVPDADQSDNDCFSQYSTF